jgi:SAM-dependent methyltransferase
MSELALREAEKLGKWYHRIDLGGGYFTPSDRDQALTFALYESRLPADFSGLRVLDLGANACGLSIEFAKRGASVVAIELSATYVRQAEFIINHFDLSDKITIERADLFDALSFGEFDIVCYVGLAYHIRHPQLALDMLSHCCRDILLASTQSIEGDGLMMRNRAFTKRDRAAGELYGWEPTEPLFLDMIAHAGFRDAELVSTFPHPGEKPGAILGNRSYYFAKAGEQVPLPFVTKGFNGKPQIKYRS